MAAGMSRLEKLKMLEAQLSECLAVCSIKEMAPIARQYRETLKEIEEIEGAEANDDDIAAIISEREAAGKARAVR